MTSVVSASTFFFWLIGVNSSTLLNTNTFLNRYLDVSVSGSVIGFLC